MKGKASVRFCTQTLSDSPHGKAIPAPLRNFLDKREIKIPLGRDYIVTGHRAREVAVRNDHLFDQASAALAQQEKFSSNKIARYDEQTDDNPADQLRKADFIAYCDQRPKAGKAPRTIHKYK